MHSSKEKWNAKYSAKTTYSKEPDHFLMENVQMLKKGSVLDFACGTGRNAVWLAKNGFEVHGADISEVGLGHLERESIENELYVETWVIDLTSQKDLATLSTYDNIIINMYKPSVDVLLKLPDHLNDGGILLICTHNWKQVEAGKFKKEFGLGPNELVDLKWKLKVLKYSSLEWNSGFYDGYIFSK